VASENETTSGAYGAIEGLVQTADSPRGSGFTIHDGTYACDVSCHVIDGFDPTTMRGAWGRRAIVEGWVVREAHTGRPLTVQLVSNVIPRPELEADSYTQARGALEGYWDDVSPEQAIQWMRDVPGAGGRE
jgi:hypothetical protein